MSSDFESILSTMKNKHQLDVKLLLHCSGILWMYFLSHSLTIGGASLEGFLELDFGTL